MEGHSTQLALPTQTLKTITQYTKYLYVKQPCHLGSADDDVTYNTVISITFDYTCTP